ncbi:MAG: SPOR domain-containing protein [Synergistaceae bacterium]|jgi:cell division septation protein DedD|nr:SPOR domain-containing protein [Synergistaceae bacterium]
MSATTRRSRNYKEKSSMFTFGHFALPLAAVVALGLLFFGIKLFFLAPPDKMGTAAPGVKTAAAPEAGVELEPIRMNTGWDNPDVDIDDAQPEGVIIGVTDRTPSAPTPSRERGESITLAGPIGVAEVVTRRAENSEKPASKTETRPNRAVTPKAPSSPVKSDSGRWAVQVGAFVNQSGATTMAEQVNRLGYKATVSRSDASGKTYHRVRVMAGNNRESANKLAAELERKGYPVAVVPAQ